MSDGRANNRCQAFDALCLFTNTVIVRAEHLELIIGSWQIVNCNVTDTKLWQCCRY